MALALPSNLKYSELPEVNMISAPAVSFLIVKLPSVSLIVPLVPS